jgi:cytochrome P450
MTDVTELDLTDPETYRTTDHLAVWRAARRDHPVVLLESGRHGPYWSVTAHHLARQVLTDTDHFVSSEGMRIGSDPAAVAAAANRMLVVADGADHSRVRAAHARWFTAQRVNALGDALYRHLDVLVASMATGEPVDVVDVLADAVPTYVMGEMLHTEPEDTDRLSRLVRAAFDETPDLEDAAGRRNRAEASLRVFSYFADLVRDRRQTQPGDDVVSVLMRPAGRHRPLSTEEVLLNCDGLVNGGLGTSRHAISGTLLAFASNPDQWLELRRNRSLLTTAVEEVLRWVSPPMHMMRTASADVVLGDARIKAGDRVVLWIPSCNRDESVFPDPDAFRIDRRPNPHLSLGAGPHYCVGASVGRTEIRVLLRVLLDRVASMELRGAPVRSASTFLNGLDRLQVALTPIEDAGGEA